MKVSIIVPIYNVALESFKVCMDSLLNQTLQDFEIIMIDDCGEERESLTYASELAENDSRIKLIKNESNIGAGKSRNKGIEEAQGEYVAFIDADDRIDYDFFEKLYEKTKEHKYDIVKGGFYGSKLNEKIRREQLEGKTLWESFVWQHTTAIYRLEYIRQNDVRYGQSGVSQDVTFLLQATYFCNSIAFVDDVFYYYDRENQSSITHTTLEDNNIEAGKAVAERMNFLLAHVDSDNPSFKRYMDFNTKRLSERIEKSKMKGEEEIKVSVVVPTYNAGEYLEDLIKIIQNQTLEELELIFVDDGSTDEGAKIIRKAMKEDSRIRYFYQANAGAGVARNNGINHAKGKYVVCIDADDIYDNNYLEVMYNYAEESKADITMCLFRRMDYWKNTQTENEGYKRDYVPLNKVFNKNQVDRVCVLFNPGPINKLYRRKFIMENDLKYSHSHIANDVSFFYKAILSAKRVYCTPDHLLTVRRYVNPNSISARRQEYLEESIGSIQEFWDWIKEKDFFNEAYKAQVVKIFVNGAEYNAQYDDGSNTKFYDKCVELINNMTSSNVSLDLIINTFNLKVTPDYVEKTLKRLEDKGTTGKELEMWHNRLLFNVKINEYLMGLKALSEDVYEEPKDTIVKTAKIKPASKNQSNVTDKAEEVATEKIEKINVANQIEKTGSELIKTDNIGNNVTVEKRKTTMLTKLKKLLSRIWPVTIKRYGAGINELMKQLRLQKRDMNLLKKDMGSLKKDTGSLKKDTGSLKKDTGSLKKDMDSLKKNIETQKKDINKFSNELISLKEQQKEGFTQFAQMQDEMLRKNNETLESILIAQEKRSNALLETIFTIQEEKNNELLKIYIKQQEEFESKILREIEKKNNHNLEQLSEFVEVQMHNYLRPEEELTYGLSDSDRKDCCKNEIFPSKNNVVVEIMGPSGIGKTTLLEKIKKENFDCLIGSDIDNYAKVHAKILNSNIENLDKKIMQDCGSEISEFTDFCIDIAKEAKVDGIQLLGIFGLIKERCLRFGYIDSIKDEVNLIHDESLLHGASSVLPFLENYKVRAEEYFNKVPVPHAVIICEARTDVIVDRILRMKKRKNIYYGLDVDGLKKRVEIVKSINRTAANILRNRGVKVYFLDMNGEIQEIKQDFISIMDSVGIEKKEEIVVDDVVLETLKTELLSVSGSFQANGRRHMRKTQDMFYCSFRTPALEIAREESQRCAAQRLTKFGLTKDILSKKTVLDLGSNSGAMLFEASNYGIAYGRGIEYDGEKVKVAKKIATVSNLNNLDFLQGDIDKLSVSNTGYYDIVFCLAIESHVKDKQHLLELLADVTREMLCFEGNGGCDIEEIGNELLSLGFSKIEYLGYCDDDIVMENNKRPILIAKK